MATGRVTALVRVKTTAKRNSIQLKMKANVPVAISPGTASGSVMRRNAPNRVELKDPKPGKAYQIAIFAINGPISAMPKNALFLKNTHLELSDPK